MIKKYFKYKKGRFFDNGKEELGYYSISEEGVGYRLYCFYMFLNGMYSEQDIYDDTTAAIISEYEGMVEIYYQGDFKDKAVIRFRTDKEEEEFDKSFNQYEDERWDDMFKLTFSSFDYEYLKNRWNEIILEQPNYIIFELDDSGKMDKVKIISKDELSDKDRAVMKKNEEEKLIHEEADKLYGLVKPDVIDNQWWGPEDSIFEYELKEYYGKKKEDISYPVYTKKSIGHELKEMVARREYFQIIGRSMLRFSYFTIEDSDQDFLDLLWELSDMRQDPNLYKNFYRISYQKLDEIADQLIAGERVNFSWENYRGEDES